MTPARRKLRLGMVGGGPGSNIGDTHRRAAAFDGRYALVAGVFATDARRSRDFAASLEIEPERRYGSWEEMAEREPARKDGIEVVAIMTPNASHHPIARAFLELGVDVICDKPLTTELEDAVDGGHRIRVELGAHPAGDGELVQMAAQPEPGHVGHR